MATGSSESSVFTCHTTRHYLVCSDYADSRFHWNAVTYPLDYPSRYLSSCTHVTCCLLNIEFFLGHDSVSISSCRRFGGAAVMFRSKVPLPFSCICIKSTFSATGVNKFLVQSNSVITSWKGLNILYRYKRAFLGEKIENNEMSGACSAYGRQWRRIQGFGGEIWGKETTWETQA